MFLRVSVLINADTVHGSLRFSFPILSLAPGISVAKWRLILSCARVPTLHPGVAARGGGGTVIGSELSS
jgi:hypothetical protein